MGRLYGVIWEGGLAEDDLEVRIGGGDGHDVEGIHQGLEDGGGDEGGKAGTQANVLDTE